MIGRTVSHYRILSRLGEGGMGVVYKAQDLRLARTVALKFLPHGIGQDSPARARFLNEARAAASLDHSSICHVWDIDQDGDRPFLVMSYIDGASLRDRLADGPLPVEEALRIAIQVADGLADAHAQGIVHRDIKPSNILISADGRAKVTDFGLALLADETRLTGAGLAVGTPLYMAPEQIGGGDVDHRADIWALGVVLHEMLTGRKAFPGQSFQEIFYKILNNRADPLTHHYPHCPEPLQAVIDRSLAKRPEDRFPELEAMSRELERIEAGLGGRAYRLTEPVDLDTGRTARVRQDSLDRVRHLAEAGSLDEARRQLADIRREVKADDPPLLARLEEVEGRIRYLADRTAVAHRLEAVVTMAREGLFQRAESLLERLERDYPGAEEVFQARQTVLEEKRQNEKYHFIKTQVARARLQEESGDLEGALQAIEEALVVYPEEKVLLGYYKKVDARRAARTQRQYIRETCTEVSTLLAGGRLGEAIRRVEQALGRFPDEEVFRNLYRTLLAQKPPPGA